MFGNEAVPLTVVWQDRIKGSWWKAPLIILAYFYLRVLLELEVVKRGLANMPNSLSAEALLSGEGIMKAMAEAEIFYHLQAFILLGLVLLAVHLFKFKLFSFKELSRKGILQTISLFVSFILVQILFGQLIEWLIPGYEQPENQTLLIQLMQNTHPIGMFINIVILTPIIEEIICRGLIMKYTFSLMPVMGAFVSMVFFTLLHSPSNIGDFMIYFILAAGITLVYWKSRKLEYAILFHMLQNFLGFISICLLK